MRRFLFIFVLLIGLSVPDGAFASTRVKDIASIDGVRDNQLFGFGMVIGLDGTGDKSASFTQGSLENMLTRLGVTYDPGKLKTKNIASVIVTATLPPYGQAGNRIDVVVSSLGDASSLQGGVLLLTPLQGPDGQVYAVAQGQISVGGFEAKGRSAGQDRHVLVARIPQGALIEREVPSSISDGERIMLTLHDPDFTTAQRLVRALTEHFHERIAQALNGGTIEVRIPAVYRGDPVRFIAELEDLGIEPDARARVVINERTGTVVVGENVEIFPVAIAHGDLTIRIEATPDEGLPAGAEGRVGSISATTVKDIAQSLNQLGVLPQEIIAIFQAIKEAGALPADLEIM